MKINIKYFGLVAEHTGVQEEAVSLASCDSIEKLHQYLQEKYPGISDLTFQYAVNQSVVASATLQKDDEVALLPPFAGG